MDPLDLMDHFLLLDLVDLVDLSLRPGLVNLVDLVHPEKNVTL